MPSSRQSFAIDTIFGVVAVAAIPKCGTHTLHSIKKFMIDADQLYDYKTRVAIVRNPLDRLRGFYHFCMQRHIPLGSQIVDVWEDYVDLALVSNDEHVTPQSEFIGESFNVLVKIESMSKYLDSVRLTETPRLNQSTRDIEVDLSYRIDDINERYRNDFAIYSRALG